MPLTAALWLMGVATLTALSFKRAAYAFALYLFTFFMFPNLWWWGRASHLAGYRWNLFAGLVFLTALGVQQMRRSAHKDDPRVAAARLSTGRFITVVGMLMVLNATVVHFFLAPDLAISVDSFSLLAKFFVLYFMMVAAVHDRHDLNIVMLAIAIGAGYIGFEITVRGAGHIVAGRLEGAGAPGATTANGLASLMVTALPLIGAIFFTGGNAAKIIVAICGPLVVNVILLCNSRGTFLAGVVAAIVFLLLSGGPARKKSFAAAALGGLAVFLLLGDPQIVNRFLTVFNREEDMDKSASSRLVFWQAGMAMVADRPFGSGGDGYKRALGHLYLLQVGLNLDVRSVHNGFINDACEWGLQGLTLRMMFFGFGILLALKTGRLARRARDANTVIIMAALCASITALFVTSVFGDFIDSEWGFWMVALLVAYARVYAGERAAETVLSAPTGAQPALVPVPVGMPAPAYHGRPVTRPIASRRV